MKRYYLFMCLFLCGVNLSAQSFEDFKAQQNARFNQFKQDKQAEFDAFRKKLNNMHDAEMMDISAELTALDQMLKREGLKDPRLKLTLGEIKND